MKPLSDLSPVVPSTEFLGAHGHVHTSTTVPRLPQDIAVSPKPPELLKTTRPISRSATQNAWAQERVRYLQELGVRNLRVNQQQINALLRRVGITRPDIQYTYQGRRFYELLQASTSQQDISPVDQSLSNDSDGMIYS